MKIAVVSTGRSRCTLLGHYLHTLHSDLEFCNEFYTEASWQQKHNVIELTEELLAKENYIVKIMSLNLHSDKYGPDDFKFEEYNQLHLIERHDFFEQCCSWHVARTHHYYHQRTDMETHSEKTFNILRTQEGKLQLDRIKDYAKYVETYLRFKKYIIDKNLDFNLYTYEDAKQFDKKQNIVQDSNLDYSSMIKNYNLKDTVNAIFNKHFSYENVTYDLEAFNQEISEVKGLRSLQSFANKMSESWNK
jgi:hypothetical protein